MQGSRHLVVAVILATVVVAPAAVASGGLETFLDDIELKAHADLGSFKADLTLTFGVPESRVEGLFEIMPKASDVYMCLRIGEIAHQPLDRVVEEHRRNAGQGWGVIAKNLGIQPGSDEFHALKAGRLGSAAGNPGSKNKGKGKS